MTDDDIRTVFFLLTGAIITMFVALLVMVFSLAELRRRLDRTNWRLGELDEQVCHHLRDHRGAVKRD